MQTNRVIGILTALNFVALGMMLVRQARPVEANGLAPALRAHSLEIVDTQGKVRASIQVMPEGPATLNGRPVQSSGKIYPEAVVLRLIRPDGRPSVKIATTEQGSGIDLGRGIDPTYLVLSAQGGETSVTLTNKDGRQQVLKP
jgi:hypothetical protein